MLSFVYERFGLVELRSRALQATVTLTRGSSGLRDE
jgi:hypothetical protein